LLIIKTSAFVVSLTLASSSTGNKTFQAGSQGQFLEPVIRNFETFLADTQANVTVVGVFSALSLSNDWN
jgi:hypothetical protein